MHVDDFFKETAAADPWGTPALVVRTETLTALRAGPIAGEDDLSCAMALTGLVCSELEAYGTAGGERLTEDQIELAQKTLRAVLERVGISLSLPWKNFNGFRSYWLKNDARGSYQARRDLLDQFFDPVQDELDHQEEAQFRAVVAEAVSPHGATGWPKVDEELTELKRRFRSATTPQDYRDVGNRGVAVLETLSRTVYDSARHLRHGESEPAPDKTKQRLGRYVEDSLAGRDNETIRGLTNKVIELAHSVKHSSSPSRREAGIAADAVILLANILRRVDQDF